MPYADPKKAREWDRQRKRDRTTYHREYARTRPRPPRNPKLLALVCQAGHPWTEENTYLRPNNIRECRACKRLGRRRSDTRRRALLAGVFDEDVDPAVRLERDGGICGICQHPVNPLDFHVDHIVPISAGGRHSYANTQTAHPPCNLRKGVKL